MQSFESHKAILVFVTGERERELKAFCLCLICIKHVGLYKIVKLKTLCGFVQTEKLNDDQFESNNSIPTETKKKCAEFSIKKRQQIRIHKKLNQRIWNEQNGPSEINDLRNR